MATISCNVYRMEFSVKLLLLLLLLLKLFREDIPIAKLTRGSSSIMAEKEDNWTFSKILMNEKSGGS